jgi:hypothetical protein
LCFIHLSNTGEDIFIGIFEKYIFFFNFGPKYNGLLNDFDLSSPALAPNILKPKPSRQITTAHMRGHGSAFKRYQQSRIIMQFLFSAPCAEPGKVCTELPINPLETAHARSGMSCPGLTLVRAEGRFPSN